MKFLICLVFPFCMFFTHSFSQVTESDRKFKEATDFVKERNYGKAILIFRELANNNEYDAQFNLAFLISEGKGVTKNYSESLFWAFLSMLGNIDKAEDLSNELKDILPENAVKQVRTEVLNHLLERFARKDQSVLTQLGDYYLVVLEEKDFANAYLWFNVASALNIERAAEKRDKVEKRLDADTIIKFQETSREKFLEFKKKLKSDQNEKINTTEKEYES